MMYVKLWVCFMLITYVKDVKHSVNKTNKQINDIANK